MWHIVAAPVLGPSLGVVRDDVVGAARQSEVVAAPDDGGLTGFAASDVGVGGAASAARGSGSPVAPAVAAGVPEGGEGVGGSGEGLLVAFEKAAALFGFDGSWGLKGLSDGGGATSLPRCGGGVEIADGAESGVARTFCGE